MMINLLAGVKPVLVLIFLLAFFGIICVVVLILRKQFKIGKNDKKPDDKKIAEENLNRLLEDVNDEETKKQFEEFEKNKKDED